MGGECACVRAWVAGFVGVPFGYHRKRQPQELAQTGMAKLDDWKIWKVSQRKPRLCPESTGKGKVNDIMVICYKRYRVINLPFYMFFL